MKNIKASIENTTNMPLKFRDNNFDLIRLFAAIHVLLDHGYVHLKVANDNIVLKLLSIFPGVPIFFVISGFLISASYERSDSLFSYYKNRFLRIYPALWICFLLSLFVIFVIYKANVNLTNFLTWFVTQITFMQFYNPEFLRGYGVGVINGSLWTISVELQFYFIVPIIYFIFKKSNWSAWFVFTVISICILFNQIGVFFMGGTPTVPFCHQNTPLLIKLFQVSIMPHLYFFIIGMFLQKNRNFIYLYLKDKCVYWLLGYITIVACTNYFQLPITGNYLNPISVIFLAILVISIAYSYPVASKLLKGNDISYGLYIYHMIFINIFVEYGVMHSFHALICMLLLTLIVALFSWKYVEQPALKLKSYTIYDGDIKDLTALKAV